MVRTSKIFLAALVASSVAFADPSDAGVVQAAPADIPYTVNISGALMTDNNGTVWSADAGVWINEMGRDQISATIAQLQKDDDAMRASLMKANQNLASEQDRTTGIPVWVSVLVSVVSTVATASAAVYAATKK